MDQSTHDVRRASWLGIITECQQRPVNVSVKQWLADNGVKEKAYYYWLRKFRREAFEQIQPPVAAPPAEVAFAEFPIPAPTPVRPTAGNNTVAVISANGITIEISNSISEPLLCMLLREVAHA
ncbi:MAG: IS66 family insertion sequence element accessory protein TnpB [Lachnospiraceae bacterium]|nr:IS66 family insertion sequence element accessory protein TnpB [Lachnospiraceae bacterium]